jgi:hypothetical protein
MRLGSVGGSGRFPGARGGTRLGACLITAGLLAACGASTTSGSFHPDGQAQNVVDPSGGTSILPGGTGATVPPSTMSSPQIDSGVLTAYRNFQQVYEQAYATNGTAQLSTVAVNPLLSSITGDINSDAAQGIIWRYANVLNPRVQSHSSNNGAVAVIDCIESLGAHKFSTRTGNMIASIAMTKRYYVAVMHYSDGTWKAYSVVEGKSC